MSVFKDNLKMYRYVTGLTQDEVAKKMGVSKQTVCNWETGRWKPEPGHLQELAELYGIEPIDFYKSN
jgi:transcriptional regulator with XRE-family HTH domain